MKIVQYLIFLFFLISFTSCFQKKSNRYEYPIEIEEEYLEECEYCEGEGYINKRCYDCEGTGRLRGFQLNYYACNHCIGTGKLPCEACDKYGYHYCSRCEGMGKHKCDVCGGGGLILFYGEITTCYMCNGEGYPTCGECAGTGKITCSECWGTRFVTCSYCNGRGHNGATYFEEVDNGECPTCEGYGRIRIECEECEGEGEIKKTRIIQQKP